MALKLSLVGPHMAEQESEPARLIMLIYFSLLRVHSCKSVAVNFDGYFKLSSPEWLPLEQHVGGACVLQMFRLGISAFFFFLHDIDLIVEKTA